MGYCSVIHTCREAGGVLQLSCLGMWKSNGSLAMVSSGGLMVYISRLVRRCGVDCVFGCEVLDEVWIGLTVLMRKVVAAGRCCGFAAEHVPYQPTMS